MENLDHNEIVLKLIDEVESVVLANANTIDRLIEKVLLEAQIDYSLEIRRDWDGVSQADYMVRKMIGEYITNGKSKR